MDLQTGNERLVFVGMFQSDRRGAVNPVLDRRNEPRPKTYNPRMSENERLLDQPGRVG